MKNNCLEYIQQPKYPMRVYIPEKKNIAVSLMLYNQNNQKTIKIGPRQNYKKYAFFTKNFSEKLCRFNH